jgi:flagellar M-ring protein FliF
MERLIENLRKLGIGRLLALGFGVATTIAVVGYLAISTTRPDFVPLYSGLDAKSAGEVSVRLDSLGIPYEVAGNSLMVPSAMRDRARMSLAAEGLPRQGQAGYELLDGLDGFGVTADMFDATYWRAKEGELARTISALENVQSARVHIARPTRTAFSRERVAPSASVVVTTRGGGQLSRRQAFAVRHIVALAVKSLDPGRVTVIDSFNGMILGPDEGEDGLRADDARIAREARIRSELEALLAAHVGAGRVRVSVAVETDNETESVIERVFDPEGRVAIHSDTTETTENSVEPAGGGANGAVGVGGNLPEGQGQGGAGAAGSSQKANTSERINYEVSEVRRERRKLAGAIKRISVAVLVDGTLVTNADGNSEYQARPAEELATIGKLVRSAIAFNAERGDVVTVENLPFALSAREEATAPDVGFLGALTNNLVDLAEILGLVLIVALLMWFVVRPLTNGRAFEPATPAPLPLGHDISGVDDEVGIEDASFSEVQHEEADDQKLIEALPTGNPELARLHAVVDDKPEETFALLRKWLHETDEEEAA